MHRNFSLALYGIAASVVLSSPALSAPTTIALWDFQDHYWDQSIQDWVVTETFTPEIGSGTFTAIGGVTIDPDNEDYRDPYKAEELNSSSDPIHKDFEFMGFALDTDDYPAQGTGNKTAGMRFNVSTEGHRKIVVKWDIRLKEESSRYSRFQYTTDGVNWTDHSLFKANNVTYGDQWYYHMVDLTGIPAVENNPNFAFRIVAEFGPTGGYQPAHYPSNYLRSKGLRWDMVEVISGAEVPAYGISGKSTLEPAVRNAMYSRSNFFTVWGKVTVKDAYSFMLDDGSGVPVEVVSPNYAGFGNGDFVKATGILDNWVSPPMLTASPGAVTKLN